MRISEEEQNCTDFDWFCVDSNGNVGHFASAGFKTLPPTVSESAEDLSFLSAFFNGLNATPEAHVLDELLSPEHRTERYLRSFIAMANRGLFSFDIESYLKSDICYFRVAMPKVPLRLVDIPPNVREVLGRTILKGHLLESCSTQVPGCCIQRRI